jgi:hypothetical protein
MLKSFLLQIQRILSFYIGGYFKIATFVPSALLFGTVKIFFRLNTFDSNTNFKLPNNPNPQNRC